ncbi:hypothetical protein L596_002083 [Steinernema carpocapsae]|uniref:PHD-type domain-containing protein n=1 Tax=Steinernema carpocapsae TaxID=34508 RepID=A0A4V6I7L0_STECR|nr:hypothetical protein L596_002083 [Steinernema carpocapsae]
MEADNAGITEQLESKFKEGVRIAHGIPPIKPPKPAKRNRLHSIGDEEDLRPKAPAPIARKSSLNIPMDGRMQTVTVQKMLEIRKRSLTMGGPGQSEVTKSFLQSLASAINKRRQSGVVSAQLCRQPLPMVLKEPMTPPIEAALSPNTNQSSPNSTTSRSSTATVVKTNESGGSVLAGPTVVLACSESRHGRQRKPTSRVQELIVDGLQHRPGKLERAAQSSFGINLNLAAVQKELESSAAEPPHKKSRSGTNEEEGAEESEEKTWCICSEKSYGEMVACDNQKCRIEWFHYHCVNISAPPTGTWLCPECTKAKEAGMILLQKKETVVKLQPK